MKLSFQERWEHIHTYPFSMKALEDIFSSCSFDLVVSMYGRLRYVAQVIKGRSPRLIAVSGAPIDWDMRIPI